MEQVQQLSGPMYKYTTQNTLKVTQMYERMQPSIPLYGHT